MPRNVGFRMDFVRNFIPQDGWVVGPTSERIGFGVWWTERGEYGISVFFSIILFVGAVVMMGVAFAGHLPAPIAAVLAVAMFMMSVGCLASFEPDVLVFRPNGQMLRPPLTWDRRTGDFTCGLVLAIGLIVVGCVLGFVLMVNGHPGFHLFAVWLLGLCPPTMVLLNAFEMAEGKRGPAYYRGSWRDIVSIECASAGEWGWRGAAPPGQAPPPAPYDVYLLMADGDRVLVCQTDQGRMFAHRLSVQLNLAWAGAKAAYPKKQSTSSLYASKVEID